MENLKTLMLPSYPKFLVGRNA